MAFYVYIEAKGSDLGEHVLFIFSIPEIIMGAL